MGGGFGRGGFGGGGFGGGGSEVAAASAEAVVAGAGGNQGWLSFDKGECELMSEFRRLDGMGGGDEI